jgi:hypothetical protein
LTNSELRLGTDAEEIDRSADLKTLTNTVRIACRDKPNVMVFERTLPGFPRVHYAAASYWYFVCPSHQTAPPCVGSVA